MLRCMSFAIFVSACYTVKQYRTDYEYNRKTDAFYKLHTEKASNEDAKQICEEEAATLMTAWSSDVVQAHGMLKQFPDIGRFIWAGGDQVPGSDYSLSNEWEQVSIISASEMNLFDYSLYETSADHLCEAVSRSGNVHKLDCSNFFPFVCKVAAKDAPYDSKCDVFSRGYMYLENIGSCYKFSGQLSLTWNQAYAECQAEKAHLLIINSEQEWQAIHNLTFNPPRHSLPHAYWLVGIRAANANDGSPLVFKTVFGQSLNAAGFDQWSYGEPNNLGGHEFCGSITRYDGKYNDITCNVAYSYICEKEIHA